MYSLRRLHGVFSFALAGALLPGCSPDATSPVQAPADLVDQTRFSDIDPATVPTIEREGTVKTADGRLKAAFHTVYTDRAAFDADFPGFPLEDFDGVPIVGSPTCPSPLSSSSPCVFGPGVLVPGFSLASSTARSDGIFVVGGGFGGFPSNAAGINWDVDIGLLSFEDGVCAVGLDVGSFGAASTMVGVFDAAGAFVDAIEVEGTAFLGVSNPAGISRLDLVSSGGFEHIDNLAFGCVSCESQVAEARAGVDALPGNLGSTLGNAILDAIESGDRGLLIDRLRRATLLLANFGLLTPETEEFLLTLFDLCG